MPIQKRSSVRTKVCRTDSLVKGQRQLSEIPPMGNSHLPIEWLGYHPAKVNGTLRRQAGSNVLSLDFQPSEHVEERVSALSRFALETYRLTRVEQAQNARKKGIRLICKRLY